MFSPWTSILFIILFGASTLGMVLPDGRVAGGEDTDAAAHPYQATLEVTAGVPRCGAVIISPEWLLTSYWCIFINSTANTLFIRAGSGVHTAQYEFHSAIGHSALYTTNYNDTGIAVVRVKDSFRFGPYIGSIELPEQGEPAPVEGVAGIVTGWGSTFDGSPPAALQQAVLEVKSKEDCGRYFTNDVMRNTFCASSDYRGSCTGDNGGPFVVKGRLEGLVQWNTGCGKPNSPSVFIQVSAYRDWIRNITGV